MKHTFLTAMLACSSLIHAGIRPADGLWSTSDDPAIGSGLMLTTQNNITVISVFTYDPDGSNAWYLASGQINDEGVLEAELHQTQNGTHIINENPETAEFIELTRNLRLEFTGSQRGAFSIDGAETKAIRPRHFGRSAPYNFPDIAGQWVMASSESNKSYIFDLANTTVFTSGLLPPVYSVDYANNHPSTEDWDIGCVVGSFELEKCYFNAGESGDHLELDVTEHDIGNKTMVLTAAEGEKYQAFRIIRNNRLLPNDGYWRAFDDPEIGSGLVMRTQGDYTVALLYTYNNEGQPIWQIAAGQFDVYGKMVAELNLPTGGTAIENQSPETASFSDQVQSLEIQLQGLELATFSIDGSAPKIMQNYNFGVELFGTDHFKINDQPFAYPDQTSHWIMIDDENQISTVKTLAYFNFNLNISPPVPSMYNARSYNSNIASGDEFSFFCKNKLTYSNLVFEVEPYCTGYLTFLDINQRSDLKIYFEDIGYKEFKFYVDEGGEYLGFTYDDIDRNSKFYQLFRLED